MGLCAAKLRVYSYNICDYDSVSFINSKSKHVTDFQTNVSLYEHFSKKLNKDNKFSV